MDKFNYQVINPKGIPVLRSMVECRYPPETELQMLEEGYTIMIDDKRLSKADIKALLRFKGQRPVKGVCGR